MEKTTPQISFIIVNFASREVLPSCLASIGKISDISKEIILVNNDSQPLDLPETIPCPRKIIQSPRNLGFGAGVNLGSRSASGRYFFFLNPDAEIISADLQRVIREFESGSQVAIMGAKIIDDHGKTQDWIAGTSITPWQIIKNNLGLDHNAWIKKQKEKLSVDWVSGGAMLIRKDVFQQLGGFDENFFLYWEDVDLCRRARKLDYGILYFPALAVRHRGGQSFSGPKKQKEYYYSSQDYYLQKHFGSFSSGLIKMLKIIFH